MKEISQQEFEQNINKLIRKEITRVDLAKQLQTDTRTLANKIYQIDNKELLEEYLRVFPYKPGKNENIDYEALIVELLQSEKKVSYIQEKYNIAERTYRRNIEKLKTENKRLYTIYKDYIKGEIPEEEMDFIKTLKQKKVKFTDSVEYRKAQLLDFFTTYDELRRKGLDEKQIQKELKTNSKEIKRKSDELDKINKQEKEKNIDKSKKYKETLKVDSKQLQTDIIKGKDEVKIEQEREL